MTAQERVLKALADAAADFPELRIGQLIQNAIEADREGASVYYVTDTDLACALEAYDPEAK